eukprot:COSAG06_NODE_26511_length_613_cov_1.033074_1_plen_93_part_10
MSEQSNKVMGVRATVISVNRRGWGTARVTRRATNHTGFTVAESDTISLNAKFGFHHADEVHCIVVRDHHPSFNWFAIGANLHVEGGNASVPPW